MIRSERPTRLSGGLQTALLVAIFVTLAGGLGIVAGGGSPADVLHYLYAVLALAAVPIVSSLTQRARPRRQAAATFVAGVVLLVLILRLFQTG